MNESETETFGTRLRRLIAEGGFNQSDFAQRTGIERSELNRTINGKREPRAHEIGWIAEALGTTPDALLEGVELPKAVRQAVERTQELARRVLDAEAERDEALGKANALEVTLAEARAEFEGERQRLEQAVADERARSAEAIAKAEQQARQREEQLRQQATQLRRGNQVLQGELREAVALEETLRSQIRRLQSELEKEKQSKVATAVISSIAGAVVASLGSD